MKKKLLFALAAALLTTLAVAVPVLAYTGVRGTVRDSGTLQPWTHGGEVFVLNGSGQIVATGYLDANGVIRDDSSATSIAYGRDGLDAILGTSDPCGGTNGDGVCGSAAGGNMLIIIDFECHETNGGSPGACPDGSGGTLPIASVDIPGLMQINYSEVPIFNYLYYPGNNLQTGTGPNVVTLAGANTASSSIWPLVVLAVVALVGVGGAVLLLRRRRIA
jgi:hypothetical protein